MSHVLSDDDRERSLSPHVSEDDGPKDNSDEERSEARRIDPTTSSKKIVRKPLPKLNPARLKGPKGVATIEKYFEGFNYHGKGHEKSDLNRIMKRLEHWAHRLFPKYQFDDFLEKVEALGSKKELQTYLVKYRKDMLTDDMIIEEGEEIEEKEEREEEEVVDEFDLLIAEQIEKTKQAKSRDTSMVEEGEGREKRTDDFDLLISGGNADNFEESEEEMRRRIERNRLMALERRNARMRRQEAEEKEGMEEKGKEVEKKKEVGEVNTEEGKIDEKGVKNKGNEEKNSNEVNIEGEKMIDEEKGENGRKEVENKEKDVKKKKKGGENEEENSEGVNIEVEKIIGKKIENKRKEVENKEKDVKKKKKEVENEENSEGMNIEVGKIIDDKKMENKRKEVENNEKEVEKKRKKMENKEKEVKNNEIRGNEGNFVCAPEVAVEDEENKRTSSKRLLTKEELDREIGAAVEMFMKKKR